MDAIRIKDGAIVVAARRRGASGVLKLTSVPSILVFHAAYTVTSARDEDGIHILNLVISNLLQTQ